MTAATRVEATKARWPATARKSQRQPPGRHGKINIKERRLLTHDGQTGCCSVCTLCK